MGVAFALACRDREGIGFVASTEGIKGEDVQELMLIALKARSGCGNRLQETIERLTDNGSGYDASETRRLACCDQAEDARAKRRTQPSMFTPPALRASSSARC